VIGRTPGWWAQPWGAGGRAQPDARAVGANPAVRVVVRSRTPGRWARDPAVRVVAIGLARRCEVRSPARIGATGAGPSSHPTYRPAWVDDVVGLPGRVRSWVRVWFDFAVVVVSSQKLGPVRGRLNLCEVVDGREPARAGARPRVGRHLGIGRHRQQWGLPEGSRTPLLSISGTDQPRRTGSGVPQWCAGQGLVPAWRRLRLRSSCGVVAAVLLCARTPQPLRRGPDGVRTGPARGRAAVAQGGAPPCRATPRGCRPRLPPGGFYRRSNPAGGAFGPGSASTAPGDGCAAAVRTPGGSSRHADGADGADGVDGVDGVDGADGHAAVVRTPGVRS
jgi:hypothetical protein